MTALLQNPGENQWKSANSRWATLHRAVSIRLWLEILPEHAGLSRKPAETCVQPGCRRRWLGQQIHGAPARAVRREHGLPHAHACIARARSSNAVTMQHLRQQQAAEPCADDGGLSLKAAGRQTAMRWTTLQQRNILGGARGGGSLVRALPHAIGASPRRQQLTGT